MFIPPASFSPPTSQSTDFEPTAFPSTTFQGKNRETDIIGFEQTGRQAGEQAVRHIQVKQLTK
jgi:hypothetical protein